MVEKNESCHQQNKTTMNSEFNFDGKDVYQILKSKGINSLYHANTVATSITYINQKHLLSRKYVNDNNLKQTGQYSDKLDIEYDLWDDIFLDAMDIHSVFRRENLYGPFLFTFKLELLNSGLIQKVRITKKNPVHWKSNESETDWYYNDLDKFNTDYKKGNKLKDVGSMFVFKNLEGKLPLLPFLEEIKLDNPKAIVNYNGRKEYLSKILTEDFNKILKRNGFGQIPKKLRHENNFVGCTCWVKYNRLLLTDVKELKRLFHFEGS